MDEKQEAVLEKIRAKRGFVLPLHRFMVEFSPKVAETYEDLSALVLRAEGDNPLDPKTQALIGVAVTTAVRNDREGIEQYILRAKKAGATDREIMAAIMCVAFPGGIPAVEYAANIWYEMKEGKTLLQFDESMGKL